MNNTKIKDLSKLFTKKGYNVVIGDEYTKQQEWLSYFIGDVPNIHHMTRKTISGRQVDIIKPSVQMPKKVAEDTTSLLYNEKVELIIGDTNGQDAFDKVLEANHWTNEIVNFIELVVGAYGDGAIVEYIANDEIKYNFIYGDELIVIDYENSTITGIAVIDEFTQDKMEYTHTMEHTVTDGMYRIEHGLFATKQGNRGLGKEVDMGILFNESEIKAMYHPVYNEEGELIDAEYYLEYESEPHFQVFKPAIVNNHDVKSVRGIAVTANALSAFDGIDNKSFNLNREDSLTRTRIFVDDDATKMHKTVVNGTAQHVKYFDENEDVFQVLKDMANKTDDAVKAVSPTYDSVSRIEAIKLDLAMIGFRCGLGTDYYSIENGNVYVNEANVISSNSDTWRNRQKHINRLEAVLISMMKATMYLLKEQGLYSGNLDIEYTVAFDDTIIIDDTAILTQLRLDAQDGIIPMYKYIMKAYNLGEQEAKDLLEEAEKEDGYTEAESAIVPPTGDQDNEEEEKLDGEE